ncbi:hypothetical protein CEP54_002748 [Fusarium duplospermum]|uniref:Peptidase A2 domain-containing protein n=1 Tax=Fusarium duplospermum TaxID=1325734 RepID=A0A428QTN8_9HYPO|nr:hypothetical protein CEP54_002748 [Fusarium duplospermum]
MGTVTDKWVAYLRNRDARERNPSSSALPRRHSQVLTSPSDYIAEGLVGEHQVNGLVDTGAERNFVSAQFVQKTGLIPYESNTKTVQLAGGRETESTGSVKVPFSFLGEPKQHILDCWIIPKCTSELILSAGFLRVTQTLTKFKDRITRMKRSGFRSRLRMNLIGEERQRLWGSMNNRSTHALLDTGCDLDLVDARWARANNFNIDEGPENRLPLELADGSLVSTTGIVRDATWTFGDSQQKVCSDFYVLDTLSVDVVFGGDFIMERDVFSNFGHFMIHLDSEATAPELGRVRLLSGFSPELARLEEEGIKDLSSDNARQAERVLRGRIRDAINELPMAKQSEAWDNELQRRLIWQRYYDRHKLEQESEDTTSGEVTLTQGSCQNETNLKTRWWRRMFSSS